MPLLPPEEYKGKTQAEKAYQFFEHAFQTNKLFNLNDLQKASDYTRSTVSHYISKKWWWFLRKEQEYYSVIEKFRLYSREQFLEDVRQKKQEPQPLPITSSPTMVTKTDLQQYNPWPLLYLLINTLVWYRISRKFRVKIWRIRLPF